MPCGSIWSTACLTLGAEPALKIHRKSLATSGSVSYAYSQFLTALAVSRDYTFLTMEPHLWHNGHGHAEEPEVLRLSRLLIVRKAMPR